MEKDDMFGLIMIVVFFIVVVVALICSAPADGKMMMVTAYCPCPKCCGPNACGITASGHKATGKFCAAPNDIPFETILDIPGYGKVPVWDRGGAIKGNRLDVFFPTHQEALNWGVRNLKVGKVK